MATNLTSVGLSYLTVCRDMGLDLIPGLDALADNMRFAKREEYPALEVAAFPAMMPGETTKRDFYGETINVDWVLANKEAASGGVDALKAETGVALEALCYCANTIGNNADREHVSKLIDTAKILKVPNVVMFIGNLHEETRGMKGIVRREYFEDKLRRRISPLVKRANDFEIDVAVENCPMRGAMGYSGQTLISNWFSCPNEWDVVLKTIPGIKFWYDPSHRRNYRNVTDPDEAAQRTISKDIRDYGGYFAGVHLKDGEDDLFGLERNSSLGKTFGDNTHTGGLWTARAPFKGEINWERFESDMLQHAPLVKIRSVEMEDLDIEGKEANERALIEVKRRYQLLIG